MKRETERAFMAKPPSHYPAAFSCPRIDPLEALAGTRYRSVSAAAHHLPKITLKLFLSKIAAQPLCVVHYMLFIL